MEAIDKRVYPHFTRRVTLGCLPSSQHLRSTLTPNLGHTGEVICLTVLSPSRVVSGSTDKSIRVWDSLTGLPLQVVSTDDPPFCLTTVGGTSLLIESGLLYDPGSNSNPAWRSWEVIGLSLAVEMAY